jgi:predicted transcriptional regulator
MATLPRAGFSRTLSIMEVLFTPELEAKLARSAAQQGRNPDELVRQVVARYFDEESRFTDAVNRGENALMRGEYLTHEQVGQRLERFLRP